MMGRRWLAACGGDRGGRRIVESQAARIGLVPRCETSGFTLFADDDVSLLIEPGTQTAVIGGLFERDSFLGVTELSRNMGVAVAADPGGHLCRHYWGSYVAMSVDSANAVHVFRDPSGAMPCWMVQQPSLTLLASEPQLLVEAGLIEPRIDLGFVAAHLLRPGYHGVRTGLEGVKMLLPGTMVSLGRERRIHDVWRPWDFVDLTSPSLDEFAQTIDRTIAALACAYRRILVTVSGGLDSSIVAASLVRQDRPVSLLTIATEDPAGDERPYAAMVAEALGLPLASLIYAHDDIVPDRSAAAHLPWPTARLFAQGHDRKRQAHAEAMNADAIFSGDGGDNVFCLVSSANPVVDRLYRQGLIAALTTARDIARMTAVGIPLVLQRAIARMISSDHCRWPVDARFLNARGVAMGEALPWHPWLTSSLPLLPGKRAHVASLARAQKYQGVHHPEAAMAVMPLLAQPVMEACLAVPSWCWCEGGENRAIARQAFADRLPPEIVHRRTKGGPDSFCVEIVERNADAISDMLMSGALAAAGIVDKDAIARSLSSGAAERGDVHRILALVDAEAWMRGWAAANDGALASA